MLNAFFFQLLLLIFQALRQSLYTSFFQFYLIKKPLFVIQGKNDPRVPASEAAQIVETVRKNNVPVWYQLATNEGHGFRKKYNRDFMNYSVILFFQEFLLK